MCGVKDIIPYWLCCKETFQKILQIIATFCVDSYTIMYLWWGKSLYHSKINQINSLNSLVSIPLWRDSFVNTIFNVLVYDQRVVQWKWWYVSHNVTKLWRNVHAWQNTTCLLSAVITSTTWPNGVLLVMCIFPLTTEPACQTLLWLLQQGSAMPGKVFPELTCVCSV